MADHERVPDNEREPSDHGSPAVPDDDDDDDDSTPAPADAPSGKRRVVDFAVEDSEWEDMVEGKLPGLGTTTHRSRNPQLPANPLRKQRRRVVAGPNVKATAAQRRKEGGKRLEALAEDLNAWEAEREERVHELAEKHGMKTKEVRRRMLALSTYGGRRKVSLYNAKMSRVMARLNSGNVSYMGNVVMILTYRCCLGRGVGERYTMPEVKRMAAEDPSILEGFTEEDKKDMIAQVLAKRRAKARGTRANNLSAAADAKRTMDRLMVEVRHSPPFASPDY